MNTFAKCAFAGLILTISLHSSVAEVKIPEKVDLVFVLDTSGSIGAAPDSDGVWQNVINWLNSFVGQLPIGPTAVQVSIVTYSDDAITEFPLNEYHTVNAIKTGIEGIQFRGGNTNTAEALRHLSQDTFTSRNGDRENVPNVAILITDGYATVQFLDTVAAADEAKNSGVTLICVGVSDKVNRHNLRDIASNQQLVLIANNYTTLMTYSSNIMQLVSDSIPHGVEAEDSAIIVIEGEDGEDGKDGQDGATGATGAAGQDGTDGQDGDTGATGIQGPQGEKGEDGVDGVDGEDGTDGNHGHTGHTGAQGDQGEVGPPGPTGERGPPGEVIHVDGDKDDNDGSDGHQISVGGGDASVEIHGMGQDTVIIVAVIGAIAAIALIVGACCLLIFLRKSKSNSCNNSHMSTLTLPRLTTDCAATQTTVREKKVRGLDNPVVLITTDRARSDNFANEHAAHAIASPSLIEITKNP